MADTFSIVIYKVYHAISIVELQGSVYYFCHQFVFIGILKYILRKLILIFRFKVIIIIVHICKINIHLVKGHFEKNYYILIIVIGH